MRAPARRPLWPAPGPGSGAGRSLPGADWEDFVTFYDFPEEHWLHLRTTNPIESVFADVRLRTNAAKRMRVRENALYLVFKLVTRLCMTWRAVNGPNQIALLMAGERFVDGKLQRPQPTTKDTPRSSPHRPAWKHFHRP